MSSYSVVKNIDGVLAQLTRLVGNGYYFYFHAQLKPDKDPEALDRMLIKAWQLDAPYWKRENTGKRSKTSASMLSTSVATQFAIQSQRKPASVAFLFGSIKTPI